MVFLLNLVHKLSEHYKVVVKTLYIVIMTDYSCLACFSSGKNVIIRTLVRMTHVERTATKNGICISHNTVSWILSYIYIYTHIYIYLYIYIYMPSGIMHIVVWEKIGVKKFFVESWA